MADRWGRPDVRNPLSKVGLYGMSLFSQFEAFHVLLHCARPETPELVDGFNLVRVDAKCQERQFSQGP